MGTKVHPGKYDCYADAEYDEPMFILLGRDRHAPLLVRLWCVFRWLEGADRERIREAWRCAAQMRAYRERRDHYSEIVT